MEDGWVVVDVEDDGTGIPEDIQSQMFQPFFTTKPRGVGSGQGLDIVHRVVVVTHGGNISVDSEPGRTCFRVRLPASAPGDDQPSDSLSA